LLRPDAFAQSDIQRLRCAKQPGFETLYQQNPSGRDRLRIKAEFFPVFSATQLWTPHSPVVLSVEPGQKGVVSFRCGRPKAACICCSTSGGSMQATPNFVHKSGGSFASIGRVQC